MSTFGLGLGGSLAPLGIPITSNITVAGPSTYVDAVSETLTLTATPLWAWNQLLTEGLAFVETTGAAWFKQVTENLAFQDAVIAGRQITLSEVLRLTAAPSALRVALVEATDTLELSDVIVASYGQVIVERLRLALTSSIESHFHIAAADTIDFTDALLIGLPVTVAETIELSSTELVQQVVSIVERLQLQSAFVPVMLYQRSIAETLRLSDALVRFFGADVTEGITFADTMAGTGAFAGVISEEITLTETVSPKLVLRVTVPDGIEFSDDQVLKMIFDETVSEELTFTAAYISPDRQFTTWVMNTRTGAVTEYTNYAFNSFARMGNVYYGASDSGLYKLVGDDDAGTDIIADIKSGFAQWAGTKLGGFKGVYLGVRGEGNFVLKVITGDDKTYSYTVNAQSMATTKVVTGKGLRARYFAFELISTGQDFDLDTVEFVPLVFGRRV